MEIPTQLYIDAKKTLYFYDRNSKKNKTKINVYIREDLSHQLCYHLFNTSSVIQLLIIRFRAKPRINWFLYDVCGLNLG